MKVSKLNVLWYFVQFRWSRWRHPNRVADKWKKRWKRHLMKSDFYQKYIDDTQDFPVVDKTIFMENFDAINTVGVKKEEAFNIALKSETTRDFSPSINGISLGLSSGTSGNKGMFLTSKQEKEMWVGAVLDRVIGFSFKKRKVAFFLRANNNLYEAANSNLLSFVFFDIKLSMKEQIEKLIELKADLLVAQPSVLFTIAKEYEARNIQANFTKVVSVAEVLEDDQKQYFEKVFGCKIDQVYQCTEGFLAHTCSEGKLHFNEDFLKIEKKYIDKEQKRFHPIITDYLRVSQPVVRYELNDIIHEASACSCGSKATCIEKIEGRSDDVFGFKIEDEIINIYPDFIRRTIINSSDEIINYVFTRKTEKEFGLYLELKQRENYESVFLTTKTNLESLFLSYNIENIAIEKMDFNQNPMMKFKRIRNEYTTKI